MAKQYRFTGYYPHSYQPDPHEAARWIVPGEAVTWDKPPDTNWTEIEAEPPTESHGDKPVFPGAETFPSAHEGDSPE